ncbi:hypothetical protein [Natronosalvus halobius]|uniref:hypothetical protein n=1 Tax=Natronosalvus halobius TaxID=2953746 RepID=UPI00209F12AC|nr:hypothetical protein [Natronosalvus halobius]USZ71409.1 hypothetical protein NGM15_15220 [Natronosalvus halobius]
MVSDRDGSSDLQLRFSGGRFERHLVTTIVALQVALAATGVMAVGFVFLATDGRNPLFVGLAVISLVLAFLLSYLYE